MIDHILNDARHEDHEDHEELGASATPFARVSAPVAIGPREWLLCEPGDLRVEETPRPPREKTSEYRWTR